LRLNSNRMWGSQKQFTRVGKSGISTSLVRKGITEGWLKKGVRGEIT